MSLKNPVTPPGIDPGTVRLVAQRLNHYATPGPNIRYITLKCKACCNKNQHILHVIPPIYYEHQGLHCIITSLKILAQQVTIKLAVKQLYHLFGYPPDIRKCLPHTESATARHMKLLYANVRQDGISSLVLCWLPDAAAWHSSRPFLPSSRGCRGT